MNVSKKGKKKMAKNKNRKRPKQTLVLAPAAPVTSQGLAKSTPPLDTAPISAAKPPRTITVLESDLNRAIMDSYDNGLMYSAKQALTIIEKVRTIPTGRKVLKEYHDALFNALAVREKTRKDERITEGVELARLQRELHPAVKNPSSSLRVAEEPAEPPQTEQSPSSEGAADSSPGT